MVSKLTYASIDIETLGLNPLTNKTIEIGIVLDNHLHRNNNNNMCVDEYVKSLPTFHCYIRHDCYQGDPYALTLNQHIIDIIKEDKHPNIINLEDVAPALDDFLSNNLSKKIMPAGKNYGEFDKQFLSNIPNVKQVLDKWFIHRSLDPSLYYFDENNDTKLPSLQACLNRANIIKKVSHTAVEDAQDVIRCLRYIWDTSYT